MTKQLHTALYWQKVAAFSHLKARAYVVKANTSKQAPTRQHNLATAIWHQQHADAAARIARLAMDIET